jgi:hypothetical protein
MINGTSRPRASGNACGLEIAEKPGWDDWMILPLRCLFLLSLLATLVRADFATDLARIHVEASGGRAQLDALHGLMARGFTRGGNGERAFVLRAERPNRVCVEVTAAGRTISQGWDGAGAPWMRDSASGQVTLLRGDAAEAFKAEAEFDDPLVGGSKRKVALDYVGVVTVGDVEWLKLVVTQNFTSTSFVYLDPSTYLIMRRDVVRRTQGKEVVLRTDYSDFRAVQGVVLPHRWVVLQDGKLLRETVIERMEPNPEIPAQVFAPGPAPAP